MRAIVMLALMSLAAWPALAQEPVLLRCSKQQETSFLSKELEPAPLRSADDPQGFEEFVWMPAERGLCRLEAGRCASTALNVSAGAGGGKSIVADESIQATLMFGPGLKDADVSLDMKSGAWRLERKVGDSEAAVFDRVEMGGPGACRVMPAAAAAAALALSGSGDARQDMECAGRFLYVAEVTNYRAKNEAEPSAAREAASRDAQSWLAAANAFAERAHARGAGSSLEADIKAEAQLFGSRPPATQQEQIEACKVILSGPNP
jgi:hypothetical protein